MSPKTFAFSETVATPKEVDPETWSASASKDLNEVYQAWASSFTLFQSAGSSFTAFQSVPLPSDATPTVPIVGSVAPLLLIERSSGGVVVADPVGAAYGVGATIGEATDAWEEQAREHFSDLLENEAALHPRMARQLAYLRTLFA